MAVVDVLKIVVKQAGSSSKASDVHSHGVWFTSWPGHQLSQLSLSQFPRSLRTDVMIGS
jgi:hypothetical protein